jgi:hypothetical protein
MAFKMKGSPMQRNFPGAFKNKPKQTRWQSIKKGLGEVWEAAKETITTGSTPSQNLSAARNYREQEMLRKQRERQEKWRKENQ